MASVLLKKFNINFTNIFFKKNNLLYQDVTLPWDNLLLNVQNFFLNSLYFTDTFFLNIFKKNYLNQILLLNLNFINFFFFYELSVLKQSYKLNTFVVFNCFFSNLNVIYCTNVLNNKINSISNIYPASIWSEREAKESTFLFFKDLKDSRRLLTDYFQLDNNCNDYKTTSYNLKFQTILKKCYIDYLFFHILFFVC